MLQLENNGTIFKFIVEASPNALIMTDVNGKIIFINKFAEKLFLYTKDEITDKPIEILIPKRLTIKHLEYVNSFLKNPQTRSMGAGRDLFAIRKDGTEFPAEVGLNPIQIADKQYVLAVVVDISERKKAEKALIESESRLDIFFKQSIEGFFMMMLDEPVKWNDSVDKEKILDYVFENQRITRINDAMLEQYGAKSEDFIGLTPKDFFAHDMQHGREVWRKFFDAGRLHIDTQEQKFDGTPMIILGDYICMYDADGKISGHFGIQREITKERNAEIVIKESENKLKSTFDILDVGITITDAAGNIIDCNKSSEKILGITKEQHISRNYAGSEWLIIRPDGSKMPTEEFASVIALKEKRAVRNVEMGIVKQKNKITWISVNAAPLNIINYGVVITYIDITEQKEAEKQLINANIELAKKNRDINQSIDYAKKIQFSILPDINEIKKFLPDFYVFFVPQNVIGGDLYWAYQKDDDYYIAAIDCTGHSVPGAMMSMMVNSLLNDIMLKNTDITTGNILSQLHKKLYNYLQQEKGCEYSQDGCDIAICKINFKNKRLEFSGARQNLYICTDNEVQIIKATPKSIGGLSMTRTHDAERNFKTEIIMLVNNQTFVMTTDGILDQLNTEDDIFGTNRFIEMIQKIDSNFYMVNDLVTNTINTWKNNIVQQDDMLLITFKI